jgi:hypothetical protein
MGETPKWRFHPLIHTIAPETSVQDVEKKKAEPRTPQGCLGNESSFFEDFLFNLNRWVTYVQRRS